jgi:hypothetical protein
MAMCGGGSCEAKVFVFGRRNIVQFVLGEFTHMYGGKLYTRF